MRDRTRQQDKKENTASAAYTAGAEHIVFSFFSMSLLSYSCYSILSLLSCLAVFTPLAFFAAIY
jgi:hypothetical protein